MKQTHFHKVILLGIVAIFLGCQPVHENHKIRIAISKEKTGQTVQTYSGWLERYSPDIEWFNLYPMGLDSAAKLLKTCDGMLISGGEDVYPGYYDKASDTNRCGTIDPYRDSLEFMMIKTAIKDNKPLVGVCRGLQIINVERGGSLIVDIPSDFDTMVIHRQDDWQHCFHPVSLVPNTLLYQISKGKSGNVASNHHQGIDHLGKCLLVSAYSSDSLPEAIEWKDKKNKGFLLAVQWHPERMDTLDLLSAPIAKEFLKNAEEYHSGLKVYQR
jgi:putative glutamine amidotransferase